MRATTPSVQIGVVALMTSAFVRITLGLWREADDSTVLLLFISWAVTSVAAFAAIVPFVLARLARWARAGLASWGFAVVCAVYTTTWITYALQSDGGSWEISKVWFHVEPIVLAGGLAVIALAAVSGVAAAESAPPRGLELAALGVVAAGAVASVSALMMLSTGLATSKRILALLGEVSLAIAVLLFAAIVALARARIAAHDIPAARSVD